MKCLGLKIGVIEDFMSKASDLHKAQFSRHATVYRAQRESWEKISIRPQRHVDSVCIPTELKVQLLESVDKYVTKEREMWYGNRGLPYRRGYLFYGAPGTGKSGFA